MEKLTPSRRRERRQQQYDKVKTLTRINNSKQKERPRLGVYAEPTVYYKHNGHARYI